jgi:transcriptional regulatory protein RtcR
MAKKRRRTVALGFLGPVLDGGGEQNRWNRWRPTVALCQHEELLIDRLVLLYQPRFARLSGVIAQDVRSVSPETTVEPCLIPLHDPWDFEEVYAVLHELARGLAFDPEREDLLVHLTTGTHVAQICLFLLTEARELPGKIIQTTPPSRERPGAAGGYSVIDLDLSKYDRIATRFKKEQGDDTALLKSGITTRNAAFNALILQISRVALLSSEPLLLLGKTGVGKSQLARRIFELKRSRHKIDGDLVEVNCATLRADSAMSALFGHKKGAFTGAVSDRVGHLRAADRGLLFLDEVGELGQDEQAMLLCAIEEKRFFPVGSDREVQSAFQLICGTNRDLPEEVRAGRFREDLAARISLWTFELPSLCERPEDIEPNVAYELDRVALRTGRRVTFNREAREHFLAFATSPRALWLANFRDLGGTIARMATLAESGRIGKDVVNAEISRLERSWRSVGTPSTTSNAPRVAQALGQNAAKKIDRFDRVQLEDVLAVCAQTSSLSEAGRVLFAESRQKKSSANDADRLRKYLARFGLRFEALH